MEKKYDGMFKELQQQINELHQSQAEPSHQL
jgi:hypothetical protein